MVLTRDRDGAEERELVVGAEIHEYVAVIMSLDQSHQRNTELHSLPIRRFDRERSPQLVKAVRIDSRFGHDSVR
jgi:hypothetical protein